MSKKANRGGRPQKPVDESTYAGRFAARLRSLREKAGKTVEEVTESITQQGFECLPRTFYRWERDRDPPLNAIPFIAIALGTKPRNLFPSE